MGKPISLGNDAGLQEEDILFIQRTGDETYEELISIITRYEEIVRGNLLELMQQRDEVIGVRKENANFLAALNEKIVENKKLVIEYDLIKSRLRTFDRLSESFMWRVLNRFRKLLTGQKSPEKNK